MKVLKPYRKKIDDIDDQIVDLLARRIGVVRDVAAVKTREKLHPVLPDRVEEVKARNSKRAVDHGLEAEFMRGLYDYIVDYCCALEARLMDFTDEDERTHRTG